MSYWVYLHDKETGEALSVDKHSEGGTQVLGGNDLAELNVTYNYSEVYSLFNFSLRDLDGVVAKNYIPALTVLVAKLKDEPYAADYWAPTPGNAGHALSILLGWAKQHPDGIFKVH